MKNGALKQIKSLYNANFSGMTFVYYFWLLRRFIFIFFVLILDPNLCNTWKFIFLGQIFCEKSDSLRWYVIFLLHKSLFPGIEGIF